MIAGLFNSVCMNDGSVSWFGFKDTKLKNITPFLQVYYKYKKGLIIYWW
jgi:hypothetical protein